MTTMITGGAGFVGLASAEALLAQGEHVVLLDRNAAPDAFRRATAGLLGRLSTAQADVTDAAAVAAAMAAFAVDRVVHGAAVTAGREREATEPDAILEVNLRGLLTVMRAAAQRGVARFVYPSSVSAYGVSGFTHATLDEADTPCIPESLYGISKYAAERMALRLGELWGVDVACARLSGVFGPWERDTGARDLLTPFWRAARAAAAAQEIVIPAEAPKRDAVYSRDIGAALSMLLFAERRGHSVYNVTTPGDWSDQLARCCTALQSAFPRFRWRRAEAGEAPGIAYPDPRPRGTPSIARLQQDLGFTPRLSPEAAFADYADWVSRHPDAL